MTLGTLTTKISGKLLDPNNTAVSAAQVKSAINDSISFWKKRGRHLWFNEFQEDVTLTINNPAFSLSTNTALYVFENGGMVITYNQYRYELTKVSSQRFDLLNTESQGRPYIWTYRNNGFQVYFYPDQAYTLTVRGVKEYTDFATDGTDDASTNDWLDNAQDLIESEALSQLYKHYRQDLEMSAVYRNDAELEFKALNLLHKNKYSTGRNITSSYLV